MRSRSCSASALATAVFVDASIVRCLLVPALMVLAASITWWLPKWLDRAPRTFRSKAIPTRWNRSTTRLPTTPRTVAEATAPVMSVLPAALGGAIGWIVGSRVVPIDQTIPYASIAVAVAAIVGAIVVWLPWVLPGSGYRPGARLLTLLCGAMAVAILYALIRAVIPYTKQNPA